MKKVFYEKVGKRYKPVKEYDNELMDAFSPGVTLVVCKPGSTSYSYGIDPAFAPMIAAAKYAENDIAMEVAEGLSLKHKKSTPLTERQLELWTELKKSFDDQDFPIYGGSAIDAVRSGTRAMEREATKMLENPAVKHAYDQFMLVWKLTKDVEKT